MIDNTDAQTNAEIRKVVQDVLVDVINEFSDNAEDLIKDSAEEQANKFNQGSAEDKKETKEDEKKEEEGKSVVSSDQGVDTMEEPVVNEIMPGTMETPSTVTAVPKVEVLDNASNIGQVGTQPRVNNIPATQDINQTMGNVDARPNTEIQSTRSATQTPISTAEEIPVTPSTEPANSGELSTFGTSIVYSQNEDGTFNVTFDKNGVTRVTTVPSLMTSDILPELEDFLVEALAGAPTVKSPMDEPISCENGACTPITSPDEETLTDLAAPTTIPDDLSAIPQAPEANETNLPSLDSFPEDQTSVSKETEAAAPVPSDLPVEENPENAESHKEDVLSKATMASLRKTYANKVMEIFKLGLLAKNAIVSESKDKFFAKDKKEYIKKGKILASELSKKKKGLTALTQEYLKVRQERDQIKKLVGIISSACQNSQKGLSEGYLTDSNSEKILKVISAMAAKVVNSYGKPEFAAVLSSSLDHATKVKTLIASEISANQKKALVASHKDAKLKSNIKKSVEHTRIANKLASIVSQARIDNELVNREAQNSRKSNTSKALAASKAKVQQREEINYEGNFSARNHKKKPILASSPRNMRNAGVIVENNYVGRSSGTIGGSHRHDGTDEMIGEIANLI